MWTDLLDQLVPATLWFETTVSVTDCRDATDNRYVELALAAQVSAIVSSDQDLCRSCAWRAIATLRPGDYVAYGERI